MSNPLHIPGRKQPRRAEALQPDRLGGGGLAPSPDEPESADASAETAEKKGLKDKAESDRACEVRRNDHT